MKTQPIAADHVATVLLRKPSVLARVPFSDTTLWRHVKDGTFPAPIKISKNAVAWREADIEAWIAACAEAKVPRYLDPPIIRPDARQNSHGRETPQPSNENTQENGPSVSAARPTTVE